MNKRDMLKGVMGAGAASVMAAQSRSQEAQRSILPPSTSYSGNPDGLANAINPLSAIKQELRSKAAIERDRLNMAIARKLDALHDLRSISSAYKRYYAIKLNEERERIHQRFYEFCERL